MLVSLFLPKKIACSKITALEKLEGFKMFVLTSKGSNCDVKSSGTSPPFFVKRIERAPIFHLVALPLYLGPEMALFPLLQVTLN